MSKASGRRRRQHSWASARTLEGERHVYLAPAAIRGPGVVVVVAVTATCRPLEKLSREKRIPVLLGRRT